MAAGSEYAWTKGAGLVPDIVVGDDGLAVADPRETDLQRKRRLMMQTRGESIRRGMIRYLFVVADLSSAMDESDFQPSRAEAVQAVLLDFVTEFFDQNPLSQLGVIVCRHGRAEKLTELSGNKGSHTQAVRHLFDTTGAVGGTFSLQLAVDAARQSFVVASLSYAAREVVVLHGALSSVDPHDIFQSIAELKKARVKVSVVALTAELFIARRVAEETHGRFHVCASGAELRDYTLLHVTPPPSMKKDTAEVQMVRWGFPRREREAAVCACHSTITMDGFRCPRCHARLCMRTAPPATCPVCSLRLASPAHLARTYHHLFPVAAYLEHRPRKRVGAASSGGGDGGGGSGRGAAAVAAAALGDELTASQLAAVTAATTCLACLLPLPPTAAKFVCPACEKVFCAECDLLAHSSLHNCPGCC